MRGRFTLSAEFMYGLGFAGIGPMPSGSKFAVGAFSESLRQEVTQSHVRVALVEPGLVATELLSHNSEAVAARARERFAEIEPLHADDVANAVAYVVTRPRHVAINELLVRPTDQAF